MFKYLRQLRAMISISASLLSWIEMGRRYLLDRARQGGSHSQHSPGECSRYKGCLGKIQHCSHYVPI